METFVYALDVSLTNTGIAIFTNDGKFVECSSIDTTRVASLPAKLVIIAKEYQKYIKAYPPEVVIMERGFTKFNLSTQAIFRVVGVTNYIFAKYPQQYIPATSVKKTITGKGNAKKWEVREKVLELLPEARPEDFDQSDALAVGLTYFTNKGSAKDE